MLICKLFHLLFSGKFNGFLIFNLVEMTGTIDQQALFWRFISNPEKLCC